MIIRTVPIEDINPAPYNPRKDLRPGDEEYEKIRKSIEEFDLVEPLVWNDYNKRLVGGHQRFKVLKGKGIKEVEVSVVHIEEEKREKALNLALNKVQGEWDDEKLRVVLTELNDGIHLDMAGFDEIDLEKMVEDDLEMEVGEIKVSEELDEMNNYIVLLFNTRTDWLNALTVMELESVYSIRGNGKPWAKGIGRVVDGARMIEKIRNEK